MRVSRFALLCRVIGYRRAGLDDLFYKRFGVRVRRVGLAFMCDRKKA